MRAAERQARHPHCVVDAAVEVACGVADGVQALDGFGGVGLQHFHVLADMHAGDHGRHAHLAVDAIERRGVDSGKPLASLAEVFVFAFGGKSVVALDSLLERGGIGNAKLLGQLVKRVGLEGCHLVFVHAGLGDAFLGHVHLDGLGVEQLARPLLGLGHIVPRPKIWQ